jgi:hypothetical protein
MILVFEQDHLIALKHLVCGKAHRLGGASLLDQIEELVPKIL